jgi:hypothetical protein
LIKQYQDDLGSLIINEAFANPLGDRVLIGPTCLAAGIPPCNTDGFAHGYSLIHRQIGEHVPGYTEHFRILISLQ